MRDSLKFIVSLVAVLALSSFAAVAQNAPPANQNPPNRNQAADTPGGPAPVHDVNGTWQGPGEPNLNNRVPPMTAAGQAKLKLNIPDPFSASSNDGWKTCDPLGMPRIVNNESAEIGFAQMPNRIVILENFAKVWREVWMDGRALPKNIGHEGGPSTEWFGYSVGHWDGDNTLVVETAGMDDKTWVDRRGYPHSVDARVEERYTRPDHNHLNWTETLNDPAYYTQPFLVAKGAYKWIPWEDNASAAPVPFSNEYICMPSQMIEYMKLVGATVDEDTVTGDKRK
jgi:hypothetical protein